MSQIKIETERYIDKASWYVEWKFACHRQVMKSLNRNIEWSSSEAHFLHSLFTHSLTCQCSCCSCYYSFFFFAYSFIHLYLYLSFVLVSLTISTMSSFSYSSSSTTSSSSSSLSSLLLAWTVGGNTVYVCWCPSSVHGLSRTSHRTFTLTCTENPDNSFFFFFIPSFHLSNPLLCFLNLVPLNSHIF